MMGTAIRIALTCAACVTAYAACGIGVGLRTAMWNPPAQGGSGAHAADAVVGVGGGKTVTVPGAWIDAHKGILLDGNGGDATAALQATSANGRLSNVECYILGLDPGDTTNDFRIVSFPMKADGTPDIGKIVFDPPQDKWNVPATYKVKGAVSLEGPWGDVPSGGDPAYRFFKVEVELP